VGPDLARTVGLMLIAYLAGSIPVGVIVARLVGGPDLRSIGSGRTGGTNAIRALGRKWAAVVVLGDLLKGALPVLLARYVTGDPLVEVYMHPGNCFSPVDHEPPTVMLGYRVRLACRGPQRVERGEVEGPDVAPCRVGLVLERHGDDDASPGHPQHLADHPLRRLRGEVL